MVLRRIQHGVLMMLKRSENQANPCDVTEKKYFQELAKPPNYN